MRSKLRQLFGRLSARLGSACEMAVCRVVVQAMAKELDRSESPGFTSVIELSTHSRNDLGNLGDLGLTSRFISEACERGDRIFLAMNGDRPIGVVLRALGSAPHIHGYWVECPRHYVYSYKAFVVPEYRGQRIAPELIRYSDTVVFDEECTHRISFSNVSNTAGLRMTRHLGGTIVGYAGFVQFFGATIFFRTPGARQAGFRFRKGRRI